jgi:hypothetical protein
MINNLKTNSEVLLGFRITKNFVTIEFESHLKELLGPNDFYVGLLTESGNDIVLSLRDNSHQPNQQLNLPFNEYMLGAGIRLFNLLAGVDAPKKIQLSGIKYLSKHASHVSLNDGVLTAIIQPCPKSEPKKLGGSELVPMELQPGPDSLSPGGLSQDDNVTDDISVTGGLITTDNLSTPTESIMYLRTKKIDIERGTIHGTNAGNPITITFDESSKRAGILEAIPITVITSTTKNGSLSREVSCQDLAKAFKKLAEGLENL